MSSNTQQRTTALAVLAVAQHAVDYDLDYSGIDTPIRPGDPITVKVRAIHLDAWLDTLVVDAEPRTKPLAETREYETVTYRAHLHSAIGEVPVKVLTIRRPARLAVVGAAS